MNAGPVYREICLSSSRPHKPSSSTAEEAWWSSFERRRDSDVTGKDAMRSCRDVNISA